MFVTRLPQPGSSRSPLFPRIEKAIDAVGLDRFGRKLLQVVRQATGCESMSAYVDSARCGPTLLLADDFQDRPRLQHVARNFAGLFWQQDPLHGHLDGDDSRDDVRLFVSGIEVEDIQHSPYRDFCYRPFAFRTRLSIHRMAADRTMRLSIYHRQTFDDAQKGAFFDAAGLVASLLECHRKYGRTTEAAGNEDMRSRLRRVLPCLSAREAEVCAMIAAGHTSEGIALTLGVCINTVQTYRKRAYAKLSISSQNQLLRLVMSPDPAVP